MDTLTMEELKQTFLSRYPDGCVSLFMPTHRAGRQTQQNPIRLKNLLKTAEEHLLQRGLRSPEAQEFLKGPQRVLQDPGFWQRQSDGLAMFFTKEIFHCFRLPLSFKELVVTTNRFHIKPLLPLLTSEDHFYILVLSQNQVRLLEGTRHTVDEHDLTDLMQRLTEAFPSEGPDRQIQFHTGTAGGGEGRPAMFHGHDPRDDAKAGILRRFRMIDKELPSLLTSGQSPLVLAGVEYLFPIYREASTYPMLVEKGIPGSVDALSPEELHSQAWAIVEPLFIQERKKATARYHKMVGTGLTTANAEEAVAAAHQGRMDVLFVAVGKHAWGRFDPGNHTAQVHVEAQPGDEDLLDLAAITTLLNGGTVYAVNPEDVPNGGLLAALFRY